MGTWVSRYVEDHHRPQGDDLTEDKNLGFSWDEARRVKATIDTELNKNCKDSIVGLLRFAGNLHSYFKNKIGKQREESFEFSNIGIFRDEVEDAFGSDWKIGRMVFSQGADVVGAALEVSIVTGPDGRINIGSSWLEGIVDGSWMEEVMQTYRRLIEKVVSEY
jgi:hypothetical protein